MIDPKTERPELPKLQGRFDYDERARITELETCCDPDDLAAYLVEREAQLLSEIALRQQAERRIIELTQYINLGGYPLVIDGVHLVCTASKDTADHHEIYGSGHRLPDGSWRCELCDHRILLEQAIAASLALPGLRAALEAVKKIPARYPKLSFETGSTRMGLVEAEQSIQRLIDAEGK